jgi:internalin A
MIPIDPYFERFFEGKIENHCISRKILEAKKQLFLSFNSDVEYDSISLDILKFMTNLKELTVYITKFHDFSPVAALKNLRTIRMGGEAFSSKDLNYLTGLEYLQEVWFSSINLNSIAVLKECKNIKKMHIYNSKMDDFSEIGEFSNLTELSFDSIECNDFSFLNSLKKMKKLEFAQISLNNLNFLEYMNKLVEFSADKNADDESSLNWIGKCSKLKRLGYPMGDIRMILNCKDLVSISIDAKQYKNLELLEQTEISSIHILNADSKEEANAIIEMAEKYADITASGYNVNWED